MDSALVFSLQDSLRYVSFYRDRLILVSDTRISIFDVSEAKVIQQYTFTEEVSPIMLWVVEADDVLVLQGKMGWNYVFHVDPAGTVKFSTKYRTAINGFCKMLRDSCNRVWGVSEEHKAIISFQLQSGVVLAKAVVENEKYCQSITCLEIEEGPVKQDKVRLYLAQEGNLIRRFDVEIKIEEDDMVEHCGALSLPQENEINIINSLVVKHGKMFCVVRKCPLFFIIHLHPQMQIAKSVDLKLSMPRHLLPLQNNQKQEIVKSALNFLVADENRIKRVYSDSNKTDLITQLHQSNTIQNLEFSNSTLLCGCTGEKQFFYLELA